MRIYHYELHGFQLNALALRGMYSGEDHDEAKAKLILLDVWRP